MLNKVHIYLQQNSYFDELKNYQICNLFSHEFFPGTQVNYDHTATSLKSGLTLT